MVCYPNLLVSRSTLRNYGPPEPCMHAENNICVMCCSVERDESVDFNLEIFFTKFKRKIYSK